MKTRIELLQADIAELETASLLQRGEIALRAMTRAGRIISAQANELAVIRARLDTVEARAADALGRAIALEGQ